MSKQRLNDVIQCPLDITTLDKAAALPIATSTPATNLRQYINSDLGYNDLKFQLLCSKIATVNSFEVVISNGLSFYRLHITFLNQMSFGNSDRAVYSDLKPDDGGQSLYTMSTVYAYLNMVEMTLVSFRLKTRELCSQEIAINLN